MRKKTVNVTLAPEKNKPLIVQSDFSILAETNSPLFPEAQTAIAPFLELIKSPKHFHSYLLTELSLWNGFSSGLSGEQVVALLERYSKFPLPQPVVSFIKDHYYKQDLFTLQPASKTLHELVTKNVSLLKALLYEKRIKGLLENVLHDKQAERFFVPTAARGVIKSELIQLGFPVQDRAGFLDGAPLDITLKPKTKAQPQLRFRFYQKKALSAFLGVAPEQLDAFEKKNKSAGAGVIILPCGAGKTIVGLGAILALKMSTLIVTPNVISLKQWRNELLKYTTLQPEDIGEYFSSVKQLRKVTLTTYQIISYRASDKMEFEHLSLFKHENWGLIIYDEVHMLPAKMFRYATEIQAKRRLGLTATLVREDHREKEVFSLVGPKKFDMPWKKLELQQFIAEVHCYEVKVKMDESLEEEYFLSQNEMKRYRLAAENIAKLRVLRALLAFFSTHQILIIGQYLLQLEGAAARLKTPLLTGKTSFEERQQLYQQFNDKVFQALTVSKVANFAVDLPNAEVAVQISGTFGSRQEEAQRLGRIIRPKPGGNNQAYFFSLITQYSREEFLAQNRKGFLVSQGYSYTTLTEAALMEKIADRSLL